MNKVLTDIAKIVDGTLIGDVGDLKVTNVSINTRTLQPGELYIAIKGAQFDGNDFVDLAVQAGAVAALVDKNVNASIPCILVTDTRMALKQLATAWRQSLKLEIVGITGSNGKTTVKEMMASVLSVNASILYTQGNLNNDIGVPLTLMRLQPEHRYGVIEMGANHPGEIAYTSQCAMPDVVIITNVGAAHIEGFGSLDGVARAKGELIETLKPSGIAILNKDDSFYPYWKELAGTRSTLSFGINTEADVTARSITTTIVDAKFCTRFDLITPIGELTISLKTPGRHNVMNALAVSAAAIALNIELQQIQQGLALMDSVKGRMQPCVGLQGNLIINDTYNANPSSLKVALDVLLDCKGEPWVVLGAFGELGADSARIHAEMGELIRKMGVFRLFATGLNAKETVAAFGEGGQFFEEQTDLIAALKKELTTDAVVLCKGSRLQQMEKVVSSLCEAIGN